ncbi:hypothetical protein B7P43_G15743 [Cryptotermes secundus]|uniref:Mos1 transposase HTH domain-containing protein n=1 Tax=Cryptotermes secundus TaxID=105785 RepID=A0A2J7QWY8_9NEOP|nr:hypothetical protein B7P43_G15743 [Cryptotermes secundus]
MHQMLKQAFGDNSLGQTQTYDWYKRFKNGRTSTDDYDRSGRPSTGTTPENVAKVRDLILQDRRLTPQDLSNTWGLSYVQRSGTRTTGYSTMTTHNCIQLTLYRNFWLKQDMNIKLKGRKFDTVEELNTLTKKDFPDALQKWQKRWDQCMRSQGNYFEGDGAE